MKNTILSCLFVGLLAFLGGWYPEHAKRSQAEEDSSTSNKKLEETSQSLELARLRNRTGMLWDQVERDDYGAAGEMASKLFTDFRALTNTLPPGNRKQGMERTLANRDAIIAALAKADPSAKGMVRDLFRNFPEQ